MTDYATDCKKFENYAAEHGLCTAARALWYALRYIFDKGGDPGRLNIAGKVLRDHLHVTHSTIQTGRRALVESGLISFYGEKGWNIYTMHDIPDPEARHD